MIFSKRRFLMFVPVVLLGLIVVGLPTNATTDSPATSRSTISGNVTKLQYKLINLNGIKGEPKAKGSVKLTVEGLTLTDGDILAVNIAGNTGNTGGTDGSMDIGNPSDPGGTATSGVQLDDPNGKGKLKSAKGAMIAIDGVDYPVKASFKPAKGNKPSKLTFSVKKIGAQQMGNTPFTVDRMGENKGKAEDTVIDVNIEEANDGGLTSTMSTKITDKLIKKDDTVKTTAKGVPGIL